MPTNSLRSACSVFGWESRLRGLERFHDQRCKGLTWRGMSLSHLRMEMIDQDLFQSLIDDKAGESKTVEYKSELPGRTDRSRPASSSWVQQASRRKTALGRPRAGRRGTLTQNVALGSRVVSQKGNFLGQGNKGRLISSAVRRRTGEYPPARLLLPGGLEPRSTLSRDVETRWTMRMHEIHLRPIGVVRSAFQMAAGTPIQAALAGEKEGSVELFEEFAPGLKDLDGFERIWLLYWFDQAEWDGRLAVTPYLDTTPRGVFATRAPSRPNRIGLSSVQLLGIECNVLRIRGVDVLDGTPVLDIKPYVPRFDSFEGARAGWLDSVSTGGVVADDRFERKRNR